ncbi:MAG: LacI family DNA-binding transcriptional regulator [Spirochaetales bacterium]|nr:LacI family DNA-binding transcriptional regulator [Spirochaetales bacterium]
MAYIKLKDIAKKANVSINTVSRALNNKSDIGDDTKIRIRRIADEMGYILNASASRLRSKENRMIGVIITHIDNAFYARILQGINDAISEKEYTMLALSSGENLEKEKSLLKTLVSNRVAGTIIVPSQDMINSLDYDNIGVPHITIVRKGNKNTRSYFISDSFQSGIKAAEYFIQQGCSHSAYIGFNLPVSCNRDRVNGFIKGLRDAEVILKENRIIHCDATPQAAYNAATEFLKNDKQIDSLFVYNDSMALGVIRAAHDLKIRIPEDIRILGHDDVAESRYYIPSLSTIRVPKYRLGYDSASELMALINDNKAPEKYVSYLPELIIRES